MRSIAGTAAAYRGVPPSAFTLLGAFAVLTTAAVMPGSAVKVAPFAALLLAAASYWRRLLSWRSLLGLLIAIILFIPIRRYSMPGNLPFELEPYRLMVAFLTGGWIVSMLVDRRVRLRASGLEAPLLLFVFAALGSILVNTSRITALGVQLEVVKRLTFFASFFLVFYVIVSVVRDMRTVDFLVRWLVGGGAVVAALALYESRTNNDLFNDLGRIIPILRLTAPPEANLRGARLRVFASSQHPIALGAAFIMLLPLAIYLYKRTRNKRWWVAGSLLVLGAVATVSRTSMVMLIVIGITYLRLRPVETKKIWPVLLPMLIAVHIALPGAIGTLREAFFPAGGLVAEQEQGAGGRGSGRIADIGPSLKLAKRQPLLGQGFGTRIVDEGPHLNAFILDDQWLGALLETGLTGLIAWIWLFRRFGRRVREEARRDLTARGWLFTGIAGSVTAYALAMLTYDAWSFIQVTILLFILLGIGAAALKIDPAAPPLAVERRNVSRAIAAPFQHEGRVKAYEPAVRARKRKRAQTRLWHRLLRLRRRRERDEQVLELAQAEPPPAAAHGAVESSADRSQRLGELVGIDLSQSGIPSERFRRRKRRGR
jgi:hypothetical protein